MDGLMSKLTQSTYKRKIIAVRHGETPMNEEDVARGWTDIPLDNDQYKKLKKLGEELHMMGPTGIVSCNLLRTLQTSRALAESGTPIIGTTDFLRTWDIGKYTGEPTDKVDPILEELAVNEPYKTIEGGESFEEFKHRFLLGLVALLNSQPGLLIITTHGRCLACLNAWRIMGYPADLSVSEDDIGYDEYEPGTAHMFEIDSPLLKR